MLILLGSPESTIAAGRATLMQGTKDNRTTKRSLRPTHVRTVALAATIVGVVVLPIAAANANPLHSGSSKQPSVTGTPSTGSPATVTALLPQYCGTTQSGFSGKVTAQVCVNNSDGSVTGTAFVANSTAQAVTVGINLSRADHSLADMTCTVAAHDASGQCTTGALNLSAGKGAFDAIVEAAPVNAPLTSGVLRADSGEVSLTAAPTAASPSAAAPSAGTSTVSTSAPASTAAASTSASGSPAN
jgi:hypothetical protein